MTTLLQFHDRRFSFPTDRLNVSLYESARQNNDRAKMVAEPWATSAAGRAGLVKTVRAITPLSVRRCYSSRIPCSDAR
ncbi:MAG: hypothetical protein M3P29_14160 [Acidobacteriota bacterium]|nr:hypothetical protein [Acidobacteriota bacterium]